MTRTLWWRAALAAISTLLCAVAQTGGQSSPMPETKTLRPTRTIETSVPTFWADGHNQCDQAGNLYFHVDSGLTGSGEVMRLSEAEFEPALYKLPAKDSNVPAFVAYSVTPAGTVWLLAQNKEHAYQVFGFKSDAGQPSTTMVRAPTHLVATGFAVAEGGEFLLSGFFDQKAAEDLQGQRYVALYDQSGRELKNLGSPGLEPIKWNEIGTKPLEGAVTVGTDGNFYSIAQGAIQVFSPGGDLIRSLAFKKPDQDAAAWWLAPSGGLISVEFTRTNKQGDVEMKYLVLDEATGQPYGLYVPSPELGNNAACFTRGIGFEFLRVSNGKLRFLIAPLS